MAFNLGKAVVDYLTAHPEEKFSARQIAEWIFATFPAECHAKKASSQALEIDAECEIDAAIGYAGKPVLCRACNRCLCYSRSS